MMAVEPMAAMVTQRTRFLIFMKPIPFQRF
jgi:hypothetical protein